MSRLKRYSHGLATGYLLIGTNIVYILASVPLALHYLSREEFGLWALVMQVSGYLALIDLGMTGSISRILIDHKDDPNRGMYGSIIKTGSLVLIVQGAIILVGGSLVSWWLPDLFGVPAIHRRHFQILVAGQCAIMGALFLSRMPTNILFAHQRYDLSNASQVFGQLINLGVMWITFHFGWGLYSLLAAYAATEVSKILFTSLAVSWLKLLPSRGAWGRANRRTFHELFSYGRELFFITLGWQLINASQVAVISRTLSLEAAAVWSIATKTFMLGQQLVYKILDFSAGALSEMMARKEQDRLLHRLRDLTVLSASFSVWLALAMALCNHSFLALWTKGRIQWDNSSDWLMALLIIVYSTTRCYMGFIGFTKQLGRMKYVYLAEGVCFVGLSILLGRQWGFNAIIGSAIITDLIWSGVYGFWRTKHYFATTEAEPFLNWFRCPLLYLLLLGSILAAVSWLIKSLKPLPQLSVGAFVALAVGGVLFWLLGLNPSLRNEILSILARLRKIAKPASDSK